jgi:hypothetical protein
MGIDDNSFINLKDVKLDDMTLLRRVVQHAAMRLEKVHIASFVEAATVQFETKSLQLSHLAFNSPKTCLIDVLHGGYFQHS